MKYGWRTLANAGAQAGAAILFFFGGLAIAGLLKLGVAGQCVFWPLYAFVVWFLCIRDVDWFTVPQAAVNKGPTGAVTVTIELVGGAFGSQRERDAVFELSGRIGQTLEAGDAGILDGNEFSESDCMLFVYSEEPEQAAALIEPLLASSKIGRRATVPVTPAIRGSTHGWRRSRPETAARGLRSPARPPVRLKYGSRWP